MNMRPYCLSILGLALCTFSLQAQSSSYASSAEYQGMLQELHAPEPSPIFLATGARPLADQALKVEVHDRRQILQLKTQAMEITIDRPAATLTLRNLQTRASWAIPLGAAATVSIARAQNTWTLSVHAPGADSSITLEILHPAMARLSFAGAPP